MLLEAAHGIVRGERGERRLNRGPHLLAVIEARVVVMEARIGEPTRLVKPRSQLLEQAVV